MPRARHKNGVGIGRSEPRLSPKKATFENPEVSYRRRPDVEAIENRVRSLSADQLLERYHELIDLRLIGTIRFKELFELDRIEARLNVEDQDEIGRLKIFQEDWRRERDALVTSLENLITRFRAES